MLKSSSISDTRHFIVDEDNPVVALRILGETCSMHIATASGTRQHMFAQMH